MLFFFPSKNAAHLLDLLQGVIRCAELLGVGGPKAFCFWQQKDGGYKNRKVLERTDVCILYIYVYIHIYIYIYSFIYLFIYLICTCNMYVYMYVYICIYIILVYNIYI